MKKAVLVERIWRVYWFIGLGCVFARPLEYNGLPAWMFFFEFRDIIGTTMDDYPIYFLELAVGQCVEEEKKSNQQSLSLLCLATSSPLHFFSFGSLLGSS